MRKLKEESEKEDISINNSETNVKRKTGMLIKPWKMACFQGFLSLRAMGAL